MPTIALLPCFKIGWTTSLCRRRMMWALLKFLLWSAILEVRSAMVIGSAIRHGATETLGTIAFASVGRGHFAYDIHSVRVADVWLQNASEPRRKLGETKLTDGESINYNGQFVEGREKDFLCHLFMKQRIDVSNNSSLLAFVSERGGSARIYFKVLKKRYDGREYASAEIRSPHEYAKVMNQTSGSHVSRHCGDTLEAPLPFDGPVMYDKPILAGDSILFVSTAEPGNGPRQSWAAVYKTSLSTGSTIRLTPRGMADFSPSVSPSGEWVAVASYGNNYYHGELEELMTDLYVYKTRDGSCRRLLSKHGGWPSWADEHTLYFHRRAEDGWWSVFRVILPENFLQSKEAGSLQGERITPPGIHAVTPAASQTGKWIAVATRRPTSAFRHVEIFDVMAGSFVKITENISPSIHHYNPFLSKSGSVAYHHCRGNPSGLLTIPRVQPVRSPVLGLTLLRVDGTFPSFSPDGSLLGVLWNVEDSSVGLREDEEGLYILNASGTDQQLVLSGKFFGLAWDPVRKGVLYTSFGPEFRSTKTVHIIAVRIDRVGQSTYTQLTEAGNNAFPSPSPDGRYLVFRSKRSGYKNLYIMDAMEGENKYIQRLTDGPWTDQHPVWSPTGEWIAFVSNRENPDMGTFGKCSIYLIHPNGTGLQKIIQSADDGLAVHPQFSPDGKKLIFVSDLAGISSEPVTGAAQFQPYGEIFMANLDGSSIERLTHNGVEDGTATWSPTFVTAADLSRDGSKLKCNADDVWWLSPLSQEDPPPFTSKQTISSSGKRAPCTVFHTPTMDFTDEGQSLMVATHSAAAWQ